MRKYTTLTNVLKCVHLHAVVVKGNQLAVRKYALALTFFSFCNTEMSKIVAC